MPRLDTLDCPIFSLLYFRKHGVRDARVGIFGAAYIGGWDIDGVPALTFDGGGVDVYGVLGVELGGPVGGFGKGKVAEEG